MVITLKEIDELLRAARNRAEALKIPVGTTVVDPRGDLLAFIRTDDAPHYTEPISRGKAMASAFFGYPSGQLAEMLGRGMAQGISQVHEGRLLFVQGAVPVTRDGSVIGAVGVSGGTAEQDEEIAIAGALEI